MQMDFKDIILVGLFVSGCKVMMGICEHSNEPLGTIKSRCFLYFHRDHKFLMKVPAL
jgi:hypothetical protein